MSIKRAGGHVLGKHGWEIYLGDEPDVLPLNVCVECGGEFKSISGLQSHQRAKHAEVDDSSEEE